MAEEYFKKDGDEYVKVEELLHTQEDVDRVVKERGERYARSKFPDYDDLKAKAGKVDSISEEYENKLKAANEEKSELEKQLEAEKLTGKKVKIVNEFKLSDDLAEFVVGETEDEMRERAEKLSKGMGAGKVNLDKKDKPEGGEPSEARKVAKNIFGKKSDD